MGFGMSGAYSSQQAGPTGKTGNKIPSGYKMGQVQNFTPEMMDFFSQMMEMLGPDSFLSQIAGGDQSAFDEMEAPALRQFGELQGNMASRFSGMGMGSRNSSGFQNSMNQAGSDFAQKLQGDRSAMRMNAIKELQGMGNNLLNQKPYDTQLYEKPQSGWQQFVSSIGSGVGQGFGKKIGGWF